MSKNEVPALIAAVKEHQKFRQLACYSIECLSKVIDPVNRDYKKNLAVAHSCSAGKCVVDVLKRHPGKEDVLLVCCDCLKKLAVDTSNAEVIAEEGCVDAILASLAANPELPEETLAIALSILDTLCNHNKALQTLVSRGTVKLLVNLFQAGNQKSDVKVGCLKALAKLTKVQKGIDDFIECNGVGPTLAAMNSFTSSSIPINSEIAVALTSGCKLFARLGPKEAAIRDQLHACGGTDICLSIMEKAEDPQLNKMCSKLLSHLCGSESIDNVITNLKDSNLNSLSVEKQERMLGLLSSLSLDSSSSSDIVRSGGVKVLIQSVENRVSARQLESSTRAILGLATNNALSIKALVNDGAISVLKNAVQMQSIPSSVGDVKALIDTKTHAVQALTCISSIAENVSLVVESGSVQAIMGILSTDTENSALSTSSLMFLESLCGHGGALDELIQSADIDTIIQSLCAHPTNEKLHLASLKVFIDLATSEETLKSFIDKDMIEVVITSISIHNQNEAILKEALFLLSTLLFHPNTLSKLHAACDGTGLQIVTNAIYQNMRHEEIRKVAMELISQLSGDDMIQKIVLELTDIAQQANKNLTADAMVRIRSIAMTLGVLSMVPENLTKIAASGGISPVVVLLNIMSNHQSNDSSHAEALTTLFATLEEIIAYGDNSLAGIDVKSIVNSCVAALQKHSKVPEIVMSSLRLLSAITSFPQHRAMCLENDILQAVNNIARQYASNSEILGPTVNIYLNFSTSEDDIAINLAKHNSTKMIMHCIRENLVNDLKNIDPITSLVRILNRLSTLREGADILKRQGCVSCLFDVFECFNNAEDIQNLCLLTIQILMNEKDIQDILNRLFEKSTDPSLFSLTEQSIEAIEKVSVDMKRLGLLMLCGPEVVEQIENAGGVQLIQNFLAGFSPTINPNVPESSLVARARDEFANCCIEALGRAALRNPDIEATIAAVPLIVQVAANNPTPAVFKTMQTLCQHNPPVLAAIAAGGGTSICLEICQAGNYEPDVMSSAFGLLSALAVDQSGLEMIIASNATDLVCNHITDSLMSDSQTDGSGISSLKSAINVLQSLSVNNHESNINYSILKALSEVIESLANWTRNDSTNVYPDLLASTINVVISLLEGPNSDEYASLLMNNGDIAKLDRIMYSHDDMYLKYSLPTHSLADMMCLLITKNETTNQFIKDLGTQDYLLRTMNYHPTDMPLQIKLANAIGGLGMDAALSGLFSFIEQVDALTAEFSADIIPQISQYVQLIGNLMLIEGALNSEIADHLFDTLLNACNCLVNPVDGVQSERDEALFTTLTCFGKLLAMDSYHISDEKLQRILEFALVALRDCDAYQLQPETKVSLLRMIRNLLDNRAKALEIALRINLFSVLQQLTPGTVLLALAGNRRGIETRSGKANNVVTAQSFTTEQNTTMDLILKKLVDSMTHLELLNYRGVYEICDMLCSQNTQNPGDINWKSFLEKISHQFGSSYLLDMLSELRTPYSLHANLRSTNIVNNLVKAIGDKVVTGIVAGEIQSFDQQHHLDAIISTSLYLLPNTSLNFFDCLANTPAGAYALLQSLELIQFLINAMKSPATSLHASTIIVKIASHEIEGTMKLLIDNGLTKQILSSLKSTTDESYIQNAVYLLRVFADSIGISELRLPKETIKIMGDLTLKYSGNDYLTSVAGSISGDLSEAFAIGPEAQLESQLNLFVNYISGGNIWQQLMSDNTPYFYNATTGASQWDEPSEYQTQLRVIDDIIDLVNRLNSNLSDVAISEECNNTIYSMLYNNSGDKNITDRLMKFVYAQTAKSNRATLELLHETHAAYLAHVLQAKFADTNIDPHLIEECLEITEALCAIDKFRATLSGEEYIRVLCETCSKHIKLPPVLNKGFSSLLILAKTSTESAEYCIKYNLPSILVTATQTHLPSVSQSELRKLILASTAQTSQVTPETANAHRKSITGAQNQSLGETILLSSASPVIVLFYTIISLLQSFTSDSIANLRLIVCQKCTQCILEILKTFRTEIIFTTKIIKLLGAYSLDDDCLDVIIHNGVVSAVVTGMKEHVASSSVIKITLELLSNLAALEEEPSEDENYLTPTEIVVEQGGIQFILDCLKRHEDKPTIISAAMDAMYNVVDENTVSEVGNSDLLEYCFNILSRYDYNRELILSVLQLLTIISSYNIGMEIFSTDGGRLSVLLDMLDTHIGDIEILKSLLLYLHNVFALKDNREILASNGGVTIIFTIISMYPDNKDIISASLNVLSRLSTNDILSEMIAERGCRQLMELITTFIDDSVVVALIFSLLGQLAFIKSNLKSIVQYGGIRILLDTMEVCGDDEPLMISAIRTLDNIIIADEEYANIVIEKGGKEAVEKIQNSFPKTSTDLQEIAASALLGMSARARAKGREGTKVNKGALFARINDVVDVEQIMRKEEVKASQIDTTMPDPLLPQYRTLLRAGQVVNDYVKGTVHVRHIFLTSDCEHVILKETSNKISKPGRKVPLRNLLTVTRGYGPNHYKSGLLGGKKTSATEERCLYVHSDSSAPDDEICLEFNTSGDREKWFDVLSALLLASSTCPHYLQTL